MLDILKIVIPSVLTFFLGIFITPFFTNIFYKYKMWKKNSRNNDTVSLEFKNIHEETKELSTPRIGGVIIWVSVLLTIFVISLVSEIFKTELTAKLNFFSRSQTLIPLATLILSACIGLVDDMMHILNFSAFAKDNIIYRKFKIILVTLIGFSISMWFYFKLDMSTVHIPFGGDISLGLWFIPFFIIVMLAVFSTSVIDGIDGLSGGVLTTIFTSYAIIAFVNNQIDIAAFCAVVAGGILAFLWFNIPPARFYMGETGMLALTTTLAVIAFLTNSVILLIVIAFPLVITSASVIIQIISYKYFNKYRVFKVAPLHHHFEAIGWSKEKVVMRYWVVSVISAISGTILVLVS